MNAVSYTVCVASIASSVLFMLVPRGRTRRICSLVIGLFIILSVAVPVQSMIVSLSGERLMVDDYVPQDIADDDYISAVAKNTTDNLVKALDNLLQNEGIAAENITVGIRIDEDGRIYVSRVVIYISSEYASEQDRIAEIVYRNLSKEPRIVVEQESIGVDDQP